MKTNGITMKRLIFALVLGLALVPWARGADVFVAQLTGAQETPPNTSTATGLMVLVLNDAQDTLSFRIDYQGLVGTSTVGSHFHHGLPTVAGRVIRGYPAGPGMEFDVTDSSVVDRWTANDTQALTPDYIQNLFDGELYFNIHTAPDYGGGEIRGQIIYWFSY